MTHPGYEQLQNLIAHRGASMLAPENTLVAFRMAIETGAKWIETDVVLSKDGVPMLFHDALLDRCSSGSGEIQNFDFEQLKTLDCGGWFAPEFIGEPMASLQELLELAEQSGTGLNLEIKPTPEREAETVEAVALLLEQIQPSCPIVISSFSKLALRAAKERLADYQRGLLVDDIPLDWPEQLEEFGASALHAQDAHLDETALAELKAAGIPLLIYTVNSPERFLQLMKEGVSAVFTDNPARLIAAIPVSD